MPRSKREPVVTIRHSGEPRRWRAASVAVIEATGEEAVKKLRSQVPAMRRSKQVAGVELTALRAGGLRVSVLRLVRRP